MKFPSGTVWHVTSKSHLLPGAIIDGLMGLRELPVNVRARIFKYLFHVPDNVNIRNTIVTVNAISPAYDIINLGGQEINILLVNRSTGIEATGAGR